MVFAVSCLHFNTLASFASPLGSDRLEMELQKEREAQATSLPTGRGKLSSVVRMASSLIGCQSLVNPGLLAPLSVFAFRQKHRLSTSRQHRICFLGSDSSGKQLLPS